MPFQPLTQEQYQKARSTGFSHEQILQMEERRRQEQGPPVLPQKEGFLKSLAKGAFKTLVVRPVARATEAIGRLGAFGETIKTGFEEMEKTGQQLDMPILGKYHIEPVETERQITGEALEAAAWLYAPAKGVGVLKAGITQPGIKAAVEEGLKLGARGGAVAGGLFGVSEALQEEVGPEEVALRGGVGAVAGGALGAGVGAALPVLPAMVKSTLRGSQEGMEMARGLIQRVIEVGKFGGRVGILPAKKVLEVGGRIVTRGTEQTIGVFKRMEQIRKAPKHIGEAMKQGIDDRLIAFIRSGDKVDKIQRAKMTEIAKKGLDDLTFMDQAKRLPGKTILEGPVRHLIDVSQKGVKKTKSVLTALGDKRQSVKELYNQFVSDMQRIGLVARNGSLIQERGSRVPAQDVKFYRQIFDELKPITKKVKGRAKRIYTSLTYNQMHALRQKWWETSKADQTFTTGPASYARRIRALLTKQIDEAAEGEYLNAQKQTQEALSGIKDFVRLLGYRGNLEAITTKDLKVGETFLRTFGNAADRPMSVLDKVYSTARQYGYKGKENIRNQLKFADILESIYGQPSRSIGAQVARSVSPTQDPTQVAASAVREMVKWSPYSGAIRWLRARGFLGKSESEVLRALENLIRGEAGLPLELKPVIPLAKSAQELFKRAQKELKRPILPQKK
jgi:hypothetical protein